MSPLAVGASPAPDAVAAATALANDAGGQVVNTAIGVWPVLVPVLLTLAVIAGVLKKLGLRKARSVI